MSLLFLDSLLSKRGPVTPPSPWYWYHEAISKTIRGVGYGNSNWCIQIFPICDPIEDDNYFYLFLAGDGTTIHDRTCMMRKAKADSVIYNGWEYVGEISGEPEVILGPGGTNNEVKTRVQVRVVTASALAANTPNGGYTTLTADANGALGTINGVSSFSVGERIGVRSEADQKKNGIYEVTQVGDGSNPWILTRTTDADSTSELQDLIMMPTEGSDVSSNTIRKYHQITQNPVIGTDNIVWDEQSWNTAQSFAGTILPKDGGGYIMLYGSNGPIVSSTYSLGTCESSSITGPWVRSKRQALVFNGGIHHRAIRIGSVLHLFSNRALSTGTEGRIYNVLYNTTTWNDDPNSWALTNHSNDLFFGKILQENCLGEISQLWMSDDNQWVHFNSSKNAKWSYPSAGGRTTQASVQGTIVEFRIKASTLFGGADWTDASGILIEEVGELHSTAQIGEMALLGLVGQRKHNGVPFTVGTYYKWKSKQLSVSTTEPFTGAKVLTKQGPQLGESVLINGTNREAFPVALQNGYLIRVDQPQYAELTPLCLKFVNGVPTEIPVTIVGSVSRGGNASIQAASGAYLKINDNVVIDRNKFAVISVYNYNFDFDTFTWLWFGRASDGQRVFELEHVSNRLRATIQDGASTYKQYQSSDVFSLSGEKPIWVDSLYYYGFIWDGTTFKLRANYNPTVTVGTISKDDALPSGIGDYGDELRIGVGNPTTNFNQYLNQSIVILNGENNATEERWLNLDLI